MIKSTFMISAFAVGIIAASAMWPSSALAAGRNPKPNILDLRDELSLTDEQVDEIKNILDAAKEACRDEDTNAARRECMETQESGIESQVDDVLTDSQKTGLDSFKGNKTKPSLSCPKPKHGTRESRARQRGRW